MKGRSIAPSSVHVETVRQVQLCLRLLVDNCDKAIQGEGVTKEKSYKGVKTCLVHRNNYERNKFVRRRERTNKRVVMATQSREAFAL